MSTSREGDVGESDLIVRARQGEQAAWDDLVRQNQEAAFRLAYLILGDPNDAQDVTQEAFIRAFQAFDRFDSARSFRPWLLSITTNLARNRLRSVGRYLAALRRLFQASPEPVIPATTRDPKRWEAEVLWQAVQRLRPIDQEVIYLRFFLELSVDETAEALSVAPGTVKSRLHRAVSRLRDVIESEFPILLEGRVV
jgi:RNA polymerase sigma-70 factor (ECF subfamily)